MSRVNALPRVISNPRSCEIDRTTESTSLDWEIEKKALLGFVWQKDYLPLPKLMLRGGGTVSPLRCRCRRSSWSIAR